MVKKLLTKLMLLTAVLLVGTGTSWAEIKSVNITPNQALNSGGVDPITITCAKGDGTSAPAISSGQLRLYQAASGKTTGNTIAFSSEKTITSIVFTFANNMTAGEYGAFSEGSFDSSTSTWTGSTNSVVLTVTGTKSSQRIYITALTVYYEDGNGGGSSSAVATTTTINASGITHTDIFKGTAAGSLAATVKAGEDDVENATVTWSGDNNEVATIDASTGAVTLVAAGTVTFTAIYAGVVDEYASSSDTYEMTVTDSTPIPSHTATFSVNGATSTQDFEEGADIVFPANPDPVSGKTFVGWVTEAIEGTTNDAPTFEESPKMGQNDVTYYAVFAYVDGEEQANTLDITATTAGVPSAYGTANTFSEYTMGGVKFQIMQMYKTGGKLQWRAEGNSNGTGTMYNSESLGKIESIVLTYNSGDSNKNFTLKIGNSANPTTGESITPSVNGSVYTFDCSSYNYDYFVLTNGTNAGYLDKITINYTVGSLTISDYCTSVVAATVAKPTIEVAANPFLFSTTATIICETEGAAIKYSFDNENWNDYTEALTITETKTIYAKAVKDENESSVVQVLVTKNLAEPTVTIDDTGITYTDVYDNTEAGSLVASVTYNDVAVEGATVTWSGDNDAVATINESTGAVTLVAAGTVTFTATYAGNDDYSEKTATYEMTVTNSTPLPTYTVTLGDDSSTLTEESAGAGVTLPSRSETAGYAFAGWSTTNVTTETTTAPTIIPAGSYAPTANITLYPIYSRTESGGGTVNKTVDINIGTYASNNNWTSGEKYTSATLDENVTATVSNGGGNTGKYYSSNNSWRFYANESGELTISTTNGELTSVTITYTGNTLTHGGNDVMSGTAVSVSGTSASFSVSGSSSNSQITAISVDYTIAGGGTTYYWSAPVAATVAKPTIEVAANPFLFSTTATITCETEGAAIKYSYDGENWNDYTEALTITETKTIYAKAVKDENESSVVQVLVTKNLAEPTVTIDDTGITYTDVYDNTEAGSLVASVTYNDVAVEGATITWSGNNDKVATINASTGAVTLVGAGTVTFTATFAGNDDYSEKTATYEMTVTNSDPNAPGTQNNPYTIAEIIDFIETLNGGTSEKVFVKGVISQIDEYNSKYGSITYWISDGTTETLFECYSGLGLDSARFSSIADLQIGDQVVVAGKAKKYGDVYEFNYNNYIVSRKQLQSFTVSYVDNDGWGDIYAYTFNSETLGAWPGTAMTETAEVGGKKVYTISFECYDVPANVIFNGNGKQTADLDFVDNSLYGIAWPSVNITAAGYATYCSPYALDFSEVEGLTAYVAKYDNDNDKVTFESVSTVPANTGVLLKGDAGNYTIRVVASSSTDVTDNVLVGVTAETHKDAGIYVLMQTPNGAGFKQTTNPEGFTVRANSAYLEVPTSARTFFAIEEEENGTTGIAEAKAKMAEMSGNVYDLQGRRVAQPQKGLYIMNGKKVVVK